MRSSIDETLLQPITVNSSCQNEASNSCSYLDLTVKPERQSTIAPFTCKMNASTATTPLADVASIDGNTSHHSYASTVDIATNTGSLSSPSTSPSSQYNQVPVCLVAHMPSSINQDLAEADQSIENDVVNNENAANSPEILNICAENGNFIPNNETSNEGAVGGLNPSSTLPDLAKITTTPNNPTSNCDITDL